LRPPWGGTLQIVPSRIFSSACCTPSTRNVAGDGRAVRLARNFVNFVNINDAALGAFHVVIGALEQPQNNVLHVLADITRPQ